jgi:hypothetical protein
MLSSEIMDTCSNNYNKRREKIYLFNGMANEILLFSLMYIDITGQHYYAAKSARGNKKYS